MDRLQRRERWDTAFDPARLALAGAVLSIALLLQPSLAARAVMLAVAMAAAWASGRRISVLTTAMVMAGIVAANLLVPVGKKLASFGPLSITETALLEGIEKAVTFEALIYISKACLGTRLRLPGRLGAFFSEALRVYDRILERKKSIRLATFMKDIDEALISVYYNSEATAADSVPHTASASRFRTSDLALASAVVLAFVPFAFH